MSSANAFNLDQSQILLFGEELILVNSVPNDKILDWTKLKAFADDKLNLPKNLKIVLERVEIIVGKGENAGYQHFLLFLQCFPKASFSMSLEVRIVR